MTAMKQFSYTTQKQLRQAFWEQYSYLPKRKAIGGEHCTDTRCAFVNWIDMLQKDGQISQALAERVTL